MIKISTRTVKNFWFAALALSAMTLTQNAYALSATVQQVQGEVLVQKAGAGDWTAVTGDTAVVSGDSVKTREGSCSLVYGDQATFALEKNTTLTVEETPAAQDLKLLVGKIRGKVNHQNATQPFEVVTPAAVATVRGTEVDFGFNDQGQLTVDLHNGKIDVVNEDADMKVELADKKSVTIKYDKEANILHIKNECGSDGVVKFNVLGAEYAESPCEEKEVSLATAENKNEPPTTNSDPDNPENPDELREPTSEVQ